MSWFSHFCGKKKDRYVEIQPLIFAKICEKKSVKVRAGWMDGAVVDIFSSAMLLSGMLHVFFRQPTQQNILLSGSE